jgi:hypothetical protein
MIKKVTICLVLFFVFTICALAQDNPNWFIRGQGGVTANLSHFDNAKVIGASKVCFLKKAFKNIYLVCSFKNESADWEDYTGNVVFFTSAPDPTKINLYLLAGGGYTHSGLNDINAGSLEFGFGTVFAVKGFNPLFEISFNQINHEWISYANAGLQIGLDF